MKKYIDWDEKIYRALIGPLLTSTQWFFMTCVYSFNAY